MRVMWFHLMPYTKLPDHFRGKNPSVWVDIDPTLFNPVRAHRMDNDFKDELEFVAASGFEAVCVARQLDRAVQPAGALPSEARFPAPALAAE